MESRSTKRKSSEGLCVTNVKKIKTCNDEEIFDITDSIDLTKAEEICDITDTIKISSDEEICDITDTVGLSKGEEICDITDQKIIRLSELTKAKRIDITQHPAQVFHQTFPSVQFIESENRCSNGGTWWNAMAEVEGEIFKGDGATKKDAKLKLMLIALEKLNVALMTEWTSIDVKKLFKDTPTNTAIHPVGLLVKLNPLTRFIVSEIINGEIPFRCIVKVGDSVFRGEGVDKMAAKTVAACVALTSYGIDFPSYVKAKGMEKMNGVKQKDIEAKNESPPQLSDQIAKAVEKKSRAVFPTEPKTKVVAAFIIGRYMETTSEPILEVISMGTGTKCIKGDHVDHQGQTLNDCHGEIIACRGFRRFLYEQLLLAGDNEADCVLERTESTKLSLKSNIKLYLFINTAPCGDGRVFTFQDLDSSGATNKTAGCLRTKIECGQGTVPVPFDNIQTADGILEGERLRTMSCSDKILKWNVLGVQGALLSYFINPIYIDAVIIGVHYNYHELKRALYNRVANVVDLPDSYHLNKPLLGSPLDFELRRDTSKATSHSFNWYHGNESIEVVNSSSGQTFLLTPSRLCKLEFFNNFIKLLKQFKIEIQPRSYHEAKLLATAYQKAKREFFQALRATVCGKWVGKPYEHDMFGY